ncbi:MAG: asparagine synthase (glutamine-hydrolyzing) [Nitrospirae bacterium]|nr:asparagine synthase (glutamine-hydrolyzing) [Candidatus Manganitrophaceae bacterium]
MCGIAGIWNFKSKAPVNPMLLSRMVEMLHHRGPDDSGIYLSGDLGLGHTRLSIVDLSGGHQPMSNEDGTIWVVFNGEIYNYPELRSALIQKGHTFKTHSDTEVIVHAYEEAGENCVKGFNGQFAFALWDGRRKELLLARDRMGVRPLFYAEHGGALLFGSEIKALFEGSTLPREIDPFAIDQIFTFWSPIPPRTGFLGINELPPGHTMTITERGIRFNRYWKLEFPSCEAKFQARSSNPDKWYMEQLMGLLDDAVQIRLRADVPVGAYLSGGLDSSIITALCRRRIHERLKTFSIGFEAQEFDETTFQSTMVRHLGTEHHAFLCRSEEIGRSFPDAIWHTERPVIRMAPVPMMLLARGVRQEGIKVVLTGEGADEVLAGYDIFKEAKVRRFWAQAPHSKWRPLLLRRLYPYLSGMQGQAASYLNSFFGQGLEKTDDPFYSHRPRWQVAGPLKSLYGETMRERLKEYDPVAELREQLPSEFEKWHPLSQAQYLESSYLLPGYILSSQGDRMAMAHSVEGRFPFLDHRVIEFAATIPPHLKLRRLREKHILREGARDLLPESIVDRVKQPYRAPDHASLFPGGKALDYVEESLSPDVLTEAGIFTSRPIQTLLSKCRRQETLGMRDSMALVGSLSVQLLHQQFVRKKTEYIKPAPLMGNIHSI